MENKHYEPVAYLPKEQAERFQEFLKFSGIADIEMNVNELNSTYSVSVASGDFEKADNLYHVFSENELKKDSTEDELTQGGSIYNNSAEKYSDNLSSAITFFVCGGAGLIILLLNDFNVLHLFHFSGASAILTNVVLGGLFIAFLLIGFKSLKYSKNIKSQMSVENGLSDKLNNWLAKNVSPEAIEASYDGSIPEEMKYFNRSSYLKNALSEAFPDADDSVIEVVSDQYIEDTFNSSHE